MSILDINMKCHRKQIRKTILVYLVLTFIAIVVNNVYGIFGHNVHSTSMTWMFLYPLLAGTLVYLIIYRFIPRITELLGYRAFYNCYNSGIATLTLGSFLRGILDIAGTSSSYVVLFNFTGWLLIAIGLILLLILVANQKKQA